MNKQDVKELICKAIDNVPDCAEIYDVYTEHCFGNSEAFIKVHIKLKDEREDDIIDFHNIAHKSFNTDMGFTS